MGAVRRWIAGAPKPRAIDLFCGAGGLSLGLRDAGFSVLVGADANAWAVKTHTANLGGLGYVGDLGDPTELLEQLDGWGLDHVELVAGGVPCQPFSRAGQAKLRELIRSGERHPQDPRALLWRSFMRIVERLRPDAVLVENVPDLPSWDDGAVLSGFLQALGDLGYAVDARIMDFYRFGVPQHRSRLLLTGLRGGRRMNWPVETNELVTLRDAIGDLPPVPGGPATGSRPTAVTLLGAFEQAVALRRPRRVTWEIGARDALEAMKALQTAARRLKGPYAVGGVAGASFTSRAVEPVDVLVWIRRDDADVWAKEFAPITSRPAPGRLTMQLTRDPFVLSLATNRNGIQVADPVQLYLDCRSAGEGALEAADAIRAEMRW